MRRPEGHPVLAATLDWVMAPMARLRPRVVRHARGRVLEIGVGTGLNLDLYTDVDRVDGIEPDPHMLARARRRLPARVPVDLHPAGAEALPFGDATFDTVVATWVFCTIPDAEAAAHEIHRVLRPGGRVVFVEHVRAGHGPTHALQRALDPLWQHLAGGCRLTRDPVDLLEGAGLAVEGVRPWGPQRWNPTPMLRGDAVRR